MAPISLSVMQLNPLAWKIIGDKLKRGRIRPRGIRERLAGGTECPGASPHPPGVAQAHAEPGDGGEGGGWGKLDAGLALPSITCAGGSLQGAGSGWEPRDPAGLGRAMTPAGQRQL